MTQFIWCSSVFCVLVALWTGLRIYSRQVRQMPLGLEDMLYGISVVTFYGFIVALYMSVYLGGAGWHMDELNKWHVARLTQVSFVAICLYGLSMCTVKWSMLFMLKRIFAVRYFRVRIVTWIIIGMQAAWLLQTVLIGFLICQPVQKNWDPTAAGSCGNRIAGYTSVSVVNVVVDVLMLVLPLPMVFNLQVKSGYKVGLFSIFGIGIVTVVFSVVRLFSLNSIDFDDFSYTVPEVMVWTSAENGVIILVASSALLRPVFDKMFHGLLSLSGSRNRLGDASNQYPYGQNSRSGLGMGSRMRKEFVSVGDGDGDANGVSLSLDPRGLSPSLPRPPAT
ncbi:hypothetical protein M406DRAFT_290634 [Cryphonectria parasitica EP155]|uniref:Rhodopsin domain-containing protein n=1 Tax=Cryphonectria parasitica (strain ATCC 38755 / EP155) TaxID=660469 RepID=A0A9P4Y481_CRYP1|nr:uncharacterized protein M406DRAFT_290634 [Cryphonectria parasitica EP155]KAF3766241.1 hypothetical protein M406DRAFT_290634 [Cryphonectria parasitica EP155]